MCFASQLLTRPDNNSIYGELAALKWCQMIGGRE